MRLKSILFTLCLAVLSACGPMARQEAAAPAQETTAATADWV